MFRTHNVAVDARPIIVSNIAGSDVMLSTDPTGDLCNEVEMHRLE